MIHVFSGSDRAQIAKRVEKLLGPGYEVYDGPSLSPQDLQNIFLGSSLFTTKRQILIKDLTPVEKTNSEYDPYADIINYLKTPHEIVIWETVLSRKKTFKTFCASPVVKAERCDLPPAVNAKAVFDVFDTALRDTSAVLRLTAKLKTTNDPYQFTGLLASQAIKRYKYSPIAKNRELLKLLARLDLQMKTTSLDPWILVESTLAQFPGYR